MVAPTRQQSFALRNEPKIDGDTRRIMPYPPRDPSSIRLWKEHIYAALDELHLLDVVTEKDKEPDVWLAEVTTVDERKALTAREKLVKYQTEYLALRIRHRQSMYNTLVRWPGVLSQSMLDTIQSLALDTTRDGPGLLELLLKPGDLANDHAQQALNAQVAKVHSMAYDPTSNLPFSADPTQLEILAFLEAHWSAFHNTENRDITSDPTTFVKTSLLVLRRLEPLTFLAEWLLQQYTTLKFPKTGREFIDTFESKLLQSSIPDLWL